MGTIGVKKLYKVALAIFVLVVVNISSFGLFGQKAVQPDVSASVSGAITCINTSVKLIGSSKTLGVYYSWSGPGGYVSTAQNPMTALSGDYILKVTNPINNTFATIKVKVLIDTVAPANVKATVSGLLTCKDTLMVLSGNSTTTGIAFNWNGPENYTSSVQNPKIKTSGFYKLTVTNQKNGCTSSIQTFAGQNITPPSGVISTVSGILNCKITQVKLTVTSKTKDVHYKWSGPDFKSSEENPIVSAPGSYQLTVTDTTNGCSSTTSAKVKQEISLPEQVKVMVSDTLTCKILQVKLTASSTTQGVNYNWMSTAGTMLSTEPTLETSTEGKYNLTVTNPENGCSINKSLKVIKDTTGPADVIVSASAILTCAKNSITLKANSSSKIICTWKGESGFVSNLSEPLVTKPGKYEAVVTKYSNGCSVTKSVIVDQNTVAPEGVTASASGTLSCDSPVVKLIANSLLAHDVFDWTGPQNFKSHEKLPLVKFPGNYILTVTNPENGCTSKSNVTVTGIACAKH